MSTAPRHPPGHHWVIVCFWQIFENRKSSSHFGLRFTWLRKYANYDKKLLGLLFCSFFTNSSGHPGEHFPHRELFKLKNDPSSVAFNSIRRKTANVVDEVAHSDRMS
jgi:hypothetical protein